MRTASLLTLATAIVACSPAQQATPVSSTGAALTVDYFGDTDVVGFHFQVEAVACDAYPDVSPVALAFLVDLVDGIFPGQIGFADGHRIWKACADITTRFTDAYLFKVQVWDQGVEDGTLVDLETVLGNQDPPRDSNDMLTFPIHTNWVEDPLCFEDDGTLVPAPGVVIDRAADCEITETAVWYCEESPLEIRDFVCPEGEFDPHALYPDCPNVEVCDDLDNDGDGEVDEGFVTGLECVYTTSNEGNQSAGELDHLESIYNSVTEPWTLTTEFSETSSGDLPDSYTVAISDGPNPKGQAQLALAYVDCTAEVADDGVATVPRVTVYAYNGQNDASSFEDGSDDPGPQAPDAITNSVLDPSLLLEGTSCEQRVDLVEKFVLDANGDIVLDELGQPVTVPFPVDRITIRLVMDVRGINAHNPDYVEAYDWEGIMHDERFGVWLHPRADSTFTYKTSGDLDTFIDTYSWSTEGWLDLMDRTATCEDVCIDGGPGH